MPAVLIRGCGNKAHVLYVSLKWGQYGRKTGRVSQMIQTWCNLTPLETQSVYAVKYIYYVCSYIKSNVFWIVSVNILVGMLSIMDFMKEKEGIGSSCLALYL